MTYLTTRTEALDEAAARAAAAFSRSNELVDADVLDEVLAEIADKAGGTFRQFRDAMRAGTERELPYPVAALSHLLAVTAALRAALGYTDTQTAAEIVEQMRAEDVSTREHDALRLHLLAVHGNLAAAMLSDREALDQHDHEHHGPGGIRHHDFTSLHWTDARIAEMLGHVPHDDGRAAYARAANDVRARLTTGKELPKDGAGR